MGMTLQCILLYGSVADGIKELTRQRNFPAMWGWVSVDHASKAAASVINTWTGASYTIQIGGSGGIQTCVSEETGDFDYVSLRRINPL